MLHLRMDGRQQQEREQLCLLLAGVKQVLQSRCEASSHHLVCSPEISSFALSRLQSGRPMSTLSQLPLPDLWESEQSELNKMEL